MIPLIKELAWRIIYFDEEQMESVYHRPGLVFHPFLHVWRCNNEVKLNHTKSVESILNRTVRGHHNAFLFCINV